MTFNELWLSYHQVSRCNKPATAQLIELEFQNHRLVDLEDVLDHLFSQGFIDAKYRPVAFWENHEGQRVQSAHVVEELLKDGFGKCPQSALRLVIADAPSVVWFSYHYLHKRSAPVVTQRIRLDAPETNFELIAHLTNHIFAKGYLAPQLRSKVYWEGSCGKKIGEHERFEHLLEVGDGVTESACLRLVIDHPVPSCHCPPKCGAICSHHH